VAPKLRENTHFSRKKENENHELGTSHLCIRESYQQLRGLRFFSDRMSYIILRGRWCHVTVLEVQAPTEDKIDVKDSFYEELDCVFDKFRWFCMGVKLGLRK
jgi:hypothetical protein